jgi:hypothetical protein
MEEAAAIEIFVDDMEMAYKDKVEKLGLANWVAELADDHVEFNQQFYLRGIEQTGKPKGNLRDIRRQLDVVYHRMIELIEAYTLVNGDKGHTAFIEELNYQIDYFNEHGHHHKQHDLKKAVIATIPDQVFAGVPVTVMPEVFYEEKLLVFADDYEVTYKDNHQPGTASLYVHGKGEYKGKSITRFNIVENK